MYKGIFSMKKIKLLIAVGAVLFSVQTGFSQSPSYSIVVKVNEEKGYSYVYSSKLCYPNERGDRDWFSEDTSDIDWSTVDMSDYHCQELGNEANDGYRYGNQIYVYESIANITIIRTDGELLDRMQIVIPFWREAFVTHVELEGIEFRPGVYDLTDAFEYDTSHHLVMRLKEGYEWVDVKKSNLLGD